MGKNSKGQGENNGAKQELIIPDNVAELFVAAQNKRVQSCNEEIIGSLKKWNCVLVSIVYQGDAPPIPTDQILRLPVGVAVIAGATENSLLTKTV